MAAETDGLMTASLWPIYVMPSASRHLYMKNPIQGWRSQAEVISLNRFE